MLLIQFFVDIMSSKLYLVYYAVQKVVLTFEDISWVIHELLTLHKVVLTF